MFLCLCTLESQLTRTSRAPGTWLKGIIINAVRGLVLVLALLALLLPKIKVLALVVLVLPKVINTRSNYES